MADRTSRYIASVAAPDARRREPALKTSARQHVCDVGASFAACKFYKPRANTHAAAKANNDIEQAGSLAEPGAACSLDHAPPGAPGCWEGCLQSPGPHVAGNAF